MRGLRFPDLGGNLDRERRSQVTDALSAALYAVEPGKSVRRQLQRRGDLLQVGGRTYDLGTASQVAVIGAGKAGAPMAAALEEVLGQNLTDGVVNVMYGYGGATRTVAISEAAHPVPDENGLAGTRRIAELAEKAGKRDLLLCTISGGGSALMTMPAEGVSLGDLQKLTDILLMSGATIHEINALRKHLDLVKGGGLARIAHPARVVSLILSDVVGNPLDVIASGPTVPDTSTFADACGVLDEYGLWDRVPRSAGERLRQGLAGEIPDTPKPGDRVFDRVQNVLIGSNEIAAGAAVDRACQLGFNTRLLGTDVEGEARDVGRRLAELARDRVAKRRAMDPPACIVAGGETTVTVKGHGRGGRNQEMALAAALEIQGLEDVVILCLATDGTDGPTDAAGAIVDGSTVTRAQSEGLNPAEYLDDNDANSFFEVLGDLIITGPTRTNVNDLAFIFVW